MSQPAHPPRPLPPTNPLAVGAFLVQALAGTVYLAASTVTGLEHGLTPIRAACACIGVWLLSQAIRQWGANRVSLISWVALVGVLTNFLGATGPVFDSQGLRVAALVVAASVTMTTLIGILRGNGEPPTSRSSASSGWPPNDHPHRDGRERTSAQQGGRTEPIASTWSRRDRRRLPRRP
jgi:hypothetical protein